MERKDYWFSGNGDSGKKYRQEYVDSINRFIDKMQKDAKKIRTEHCRDILKDPEKYRAEYCEMLGFPLNRPIDHTAPKVKSEYIGSDCECKVYRCQIEVFEDFYFYGILFLTDENEKRPFVISQHGGLGTPELCSSFGDSSNYNNMTRRIVEKGVNVFAPQLLLWRTENTDEPQYDRKNLDGTLRMVGSSITAVEVYSIIKTLDYFCTKPYVDTEKIGMVGLSYGGYYTLNVAAIDKRIKSAVACSHFNDRSKYHWSDYCYQSASEKLLDAETALLIRPRKFQIFVGNRDELFDSETARAEYERIKEFDKNADEWLSFCVFDGTHEFYPHDDCWLEKLFEF